MPSAPPPPRGRRGPAVAAAVALLAGLALVGLRLAGAAHGDITRFVVAGRYVSAAQAPANLFVGHHGGYDGQFYYRMALDPVNFDRTAFGVTMDHPYRFQRVTYPAVVWLVSGGGRPGLVPAAMVAVNVVGLGLLGWFAGLLVSAARRPAWLGLALPAYPGFAFTLARDTGEITEAVLVVAGVLALRARRPVTAGLALAAAVLARETTALLVAAIGLSRVPALWRRRGRPEAADAAWLLPAAAFAGWQGFVALHTGTLPVLSLASGAGGLPLVGIAGQVGHWLSGAAPARAADNLAEAVALAGVCGLAAVRVARGGLPGYLWLAWSAAIVLILSLSAPNWVGYTDFRNLAMGYVLSVLVLCWPPRRWMAALTLVMASLWVAAAWFRVITI